MPLRPFKLPDDIAVLAAVIPPSFHYPENDAWSMQTDEAESMVDSFNGLRKMWPIIRVVQLVWPPLRDMLRGFIWEEDGQPVGVTNVVRSGATDQWLIGNVSVLPEYRRRGIARELVHACVAFARERGARQITLEVVDGNVPAVALYESLGFERFSGECVLQHEPGSLPDGVPLPDGYAITPVSLFAWQPAYELARRVVPESVKVYRPVEPGRYKQPAVLRPLLPLIFRAMGAHACPFEVRRAADDTVVARASINTRTRKGGTNGISITLDPAHGALAPALLAFLVREIEQRSPGRRIEMQVAHWQQAVIDAALDMGFSTRMDAISMGMVL